MDKKKCWPDEKNRTRSSKNDEPPTVARIILLLPQKPSTVDRFLGMWLGSYYKVYIHNIAKVVQKLSISFQQPHFLCGTTQRICIE